MEVGDWVKKRMDVIFEIWNKEKTILWDAINEKIIPICKLGELSFRIDRKYWIDHFLIIGYWVKWVRGFK